MMSKTHIAVGVAAALAVAQTGSPESCVAAVVGGSIGGVIADCDITPSRAHKDAFHGRLIVVAVVAAALAIDWHFDAGVCGFLLENLGLPLVAGIALFAALTFVGAHADHRSFTHSLLAMALFCLAIWLVCGPLLPYFAVGYASHLVLDLANKQKTQLFWPAGDGVSLGLCRAKGLANKVLLAVGALASALLLAYRIAPLLVA